MSLESVSTMEWALIIAFVVALVGGITLIFLRRRHRAARLQAKISGAGYAPAVEKSGNRRNEEAIEERT